MKFETTKGTGDTHRPLHFAAPLAAAHLGLVQNSAGFAEDPGPLVYLPWRAASTTSPALP